MYYIHILNIPKCFSTDALMFKCGPISIFYTILHSMTNSQYLFPLDRNKYSLLIFVYFTYINNIYIIYKKVTNYGCMLMPINNRAPVLFTNLYIWSFYL